MSTIGKIGPLLGLAAMLSLAFPGAMAAEDKLENVSGYLGPEIYQKLEQVEIREGFKAKRWISPKLSFANYKTVLVEPVILYPEPPSGPQVSQETLDKVVTYLTERITDRIGEVLTLSDEPGPQVLRIQPAITGVEVTTEGMKAYEIVPVAAIFGGIKAATGTRDREVVVFLEVALSDSETDEMLGAAVRRIEGENLKGKKDQLDLEDLKSSLDMVGDDAEKAFTDVLTPPE